MTLIVSLRIPDGIVIAGDSLATLPTQVELHGQFEITCPSCEHIHTVEQEVTIPSAWVMLLEPWEAWSSRSKPFWRKGKEDSPGNA